MLVPPLCAGRELIIAVLPLALHDASQNATISRLSHYFFIVSSPLLGSDLFYPSLQIPARCSLVQSFHNTGCKLTKHLDRDAAYPPPFCYTPPIQSAGSLARGCSRNVVCISAGSCRIDRLEVIFHIIQRGRSRRIVRWLSDSAGIGRLFDHRIQRQVADLIQRFHQVVANLRQSCE